MGNKLLYLKIKNNMWKLRHHKGYLFSIGFAEWFFTCTGGFSFVFFFTLCFCILLRIEWKRQETHLKMKMNKMRSAKNTATLSTVLSMMTSCLRKAGMKRTSFRIRRSRNVLNTDNPLPLLWQSSTRLAGEEDKNTKLLHKNWNYSKLDAKSMLKVPFI